MEKDELKAIRSELGMTQQQLATALGLSHRDTVRGWEGRTPATPIPGPVALALRLVVRLKKPRAEDIEAIRKSVPGKGFADAAAAFDEMGRAVLDGLWRGA